MTTPRPLAHTNRRGVAYYAHAGKTKTGKTRYFVARTVRDGALDAMPAGFEFTESINGVVSITRVSANGTAASPLALGVVRREIGRHGHLQDFRAEVVKGEIVIFEPTGSLSPESISEMTGFPGPGSHALKTWMEGLQKRTRYAPVMKFCPTGDGAYSVHRMTYRGSGGWSYSLGIAGLETLLAKFVLHFGTEEFFELM
jgi:hypothetical protein